MANMRVARGTLFLGSKSKDAVNTLITEVFTRTKDWHYSTTLGKGRTWYYDPAREHYAEYQFEGTGKWTFANNIEFLLSSAKKELEKEGKHDVVSLLEGASFLIRFVYADYEMGVQLIESNIAELIHVAGTPLEKSERFIRLHESFDWTAENLVAVCGEDADYAEELCGSES